MLIVKNKSIISKWGKIMKSLEQKKGIIYVFFRNRF